MGALARLLPFRLGSNNGNAEVDCGEMLLHGRPSLDFDVSYSMPLSAIASAFLFGHAGLEASRWLWAGSFAALYALTFALGLLLGGWLAGAAALALLIPFAGEFGWLPINSLYAIAVLLVAGLLVRRARAPTAGNGVLLGLALGVSLLHRSPLLFFPLALAAHDALSGGAPRERLKAALPVLVIPLLFLLPWIAMNWALHGEFVPIERGRIDGLLMNSIAFVKHESGDAKAHVDGGVLGLGGALAAWAREALRAPWAYLSSCLGRLAFIAAPHPALCLAAAAALALGRRRAEFRALGLLVVYFIAIHGALSISEAYLIPLWPLLAALAAGGLPTLLGSVPKTETRAQALASRAFVGGAAVTLAAGLFALGAAAAFPRRAATAAAAAGGARDAWLLLEDGRRALLRGEVGAAREAISRAAALRPEERLAKFYLAWAEALDGRPGSLLAFAPALFHVSAVPRRALPFLKAAVHLRARSGARARAEIEAGLALSGGQTGATSLSRLPLIDLLSEFLRPMPDGERERLLRAIAAAAGPGRVSDVRLELARLAAGRGDRAQAAADLAANESPGSKDALGAVALHRKLKNPSRAAALLDELIRLSPADARLRVERAEVAAELGKRGEALKSLARAEALQPEAKELRRRVAALFRELGEPGRAAAFLEASARRRPGEAEAWIARAELAAQTGDREAAARALDRARALRPDGEELLRVALAYVELKNIPRAFELLEPMPASLSGDARAWLARAELSAELGRRSEQLEALARVETLALDAGQRRRAAVLHRALGDPVRAAVILDELLRLAPADAELRIERAEVAAELGRRDEALASLARAGTSALSEGQGRRVAALHRKLKNPAGVSAMLDALIRRAPLDAALRIERAEIAAEQGRRGEALEFLAGAEALRPEAKELRRRIAALYRTLKEFGRGSAYLEGEAALRPGEAESWIARAELAAQTGDRDAAGRALGRALALTPDAGERLRAGLVYAALKDFPRAYVLVEPLTRPGAPALNASQGRRVAALYRASGHSARAASMLDDLIRLAPADGELRLERAEAATDLGRRGEALESLARAEALLPGDRRLAFAYQNLKEYDRALAIFADVVRRSPAVAAPYSDKALCEYLKGSDDAALADLRTAIRLEPKFLPAYLTLGAIHSARGRFPEALKTYDEALSRTVAGADPLREIVLAARKELAAKASRP